jgi:uncharacterized protein YihD (DUF1040 family)
MKKSESRLAKEVEFEKYIKDLSKEKLEHLLIIMKFIDSASKDEVAELTKMYKADGATFKSVVDWIESKRPLELEVV